MSDETSCCDVETEILELAKKQAEENTRLLKRIDDLKRENERLYSALLDILETRENDPEFIKTVKEIAMKHIERRK